MAEPAHLQTTEASGTFPFEKLPVELQLQVIRSAMPPNGLLPRPVPNPTDHEDKAFFVDYEEGLKTEDLSGALVPSNLFQVNKFFNAEAYRVFLKHVYLVIRIDRQRIHFLTTIYYWLTGFRSYLQYTHIQHFTRMQHFRLNFEYDPWRAAVAYLPGNSPDSRFALKEKFRTICDLLATNQNIQRLTVKVSCLCNCVKVESIEHGKSVILEILAPLKRLRVAKAVVFETRHDTELGDLDCNQELCDKLIDALDADMGRLTGEELSEPEKIWREIKALPRVRSHRTSIKVEEKMELFWDALNTSPDYLDLIRSLGRRTERYMLRQYQKEQDHLG
ncbi:MAG: hypothetical protein Q9168_005788 [Polycauliona sp. 1 TL-2023]